ncbi:ATP-binding protein [Micromonospora sp. 15K316]|uniref:ATP-binding protein n=1 Tax=Micromonospora sp. 15K316 TaxID=2530376 RepID=UPI00104AC0BA|nr:ATP-binding protein [Micromonospora sp. 15K316]TDC40573.1 ATP-binding protein [Micromonospora sp. 15K316]
MTDVALPWSVRRDFAAGSTTVRPGAGRPDQGLIALLDDANLDAPLSLIVDFADVPESALETASSLLASWAAARRVGPELLLAVNPHTPAGRLLSSLLGRQAILSEVTAAVARGRATPGRAHRYLANDLRSPAAGRRLVTDCCRSWGLDAIADQAAVVVSELVSNAVQHAGSDLDLTVAHVDGVLRLSVRDRTTHPPLAAAARIEGILGERGRGLPIVQALAASWGFLTFADGKTVWATVAAGPE